MAATVGCDSDLMLHSGREDYGQLSQVGGQLGLETVLAILQILDQTVTRMRQSTYVRVLLEMALVRVSQLEKLDELSELIGQLREGVVPSTAAGASPSSAAGQREKKNELTPVTLEMSPIAANATPPLPSPSEPKSADHIWKQVLSRMEDMTSDYGTFYDRAAIRAPNRLVVSFKSGYTLQKEGCERPERKAKIEQALYEITGDRMRVDFELIPELSQTSSPQRPKSQRQKMREKEKHPLVRAAIELFDAEVVRLEAPSKEG